MSQVYKGNKGEVEDNKIMGLQANSIKVTELLNIYKFLHSFYFLVDKSRLVALHFSLLLCFLNIVSTKSSIIGLYL